MDCGDLKIREGFRPGRVAQRLRILVACTSLLLSFKSTAQMDSVDYLLERMSLEHKVGQMFMVNLYGPTLTHAGREILETWQPGAVVLLESNTGTPEHIARLTNSYQNAIAEAGGVPMFVATDQEGGIIQRLKEGFTTWPVPMVLAAADDPDLVFGVGQAMGEELAAVGVNMNLAPVADLQTNLANPIIGRRSPGSDPALVGQTIAAVVRGMQSTGVVATTKHFPGHGDTNEDSHTTLPVFSHTADRLNSVELPPFVSAIEAGSAAIMVAHIWYSAFDSDSPLPASLSNRVVTDLLRDELGYGGLIVTDALDMDAIDTVYGPGEAALMAIQAGVDIVLIGANVGESAQARAMQSVVDAVRSGTVSEARIDASVRRILETKLRFGVLNWHPVDVEVASEQIDFASHAALVEELFQAGVTLAYDTNELLPLDEMGSIAIIYPANRNLIRRECSRYDDGIRWLAVSDYPTDEEINLAAALAAQVEEVAVFTRDAYTNLPQQTLVRSLPASRTAVIALVSPYDWLRFPEVGAYMATYSPLDPAVSTACGILFGELAARGRLSITLEGIPSTE